MHSAYKGIILYSLVFLYLLIVSAILIYTHNIGYLPSEVLFYYLGDEYTPAKTLVGLLKVNLPHIFVFGLLGFVLLHFLVFTKYKAQTTKLSIIFFSSAFLDLFCGVALIYGFEFVSYIKIVSFLLFMGSILYISTLLGLDIFSPGK